MTTAATNARFCFNNWLDSTSITASSALSGYPATNLVHSIRSKLWKAEGLFEISSANNKVYINGTTYTLTIGSYTSATLITHFNSVTSQTLSRDAFGKFTITLGASGTLNLGTTTNAIWETLGYLTSVNLTGTVFQADEARYHTSEWIKVDMGLPQLPTFASLIAAANNVFTGNVATITLEGNNINQWVSPPVSIAMEVSDKGAFVAVDLDVQPCRYWRIKMVDKTNGALSGAVAYIGDSISLADTNMAVGFTRMREDQSVRLYSESGAMYIDRRPKVMALSNVSVQFLKDTELADMEQLFYDIGVESPFFLCIDPQKGVSSNLSDMTHYVYATSAPQISHVLRGYYNLSVELREVL